MDLSGNKRHDDHVVPGREQHDQQLVSHLLEQLVNHLLAGGGGGQTAASLGVSEAISSCACTVAKAIARQRAHERLMASLTPEQRETYDQGGFFFVISNKGNRWLILGRSVISNCFELIGDDQMLDQARDLGLDSQRIYIDLPCEYPGVYAKGVGVYAKGVWCAYIKGSGVDYPCEDHLLAQALMLRTDEDEFRRIAYSA